MIPFLYMICVNLGSHLPEANTLCVLYNLCMHMAGSALSIRHNNNHESTTPSRLTMGTFNVRGLSSAPNVAS